MYVKLSLMHNNYAFMTIIVQYNLLQYNSAVILNIIQTEVKLKINYYL